MRTTDRFMFYALAGLPGLLVLSIAILLARGSPATHPTFEPLKALTDVDRARTSLLTLAPIGSMVDAAFKNFREQGLACEVSEPPLANVTWRVINCTTEPSPSGAMLLIDVAARNGVVADIGVEDLACAARADVSDHNPEPGGCNLSGKRLLDIEATRRVAASALLTEVLGPRDPSGMAH